MTLAPSSASTRSRARSARRISAVRPAHRGSREDLGRDVLGWLLQPVTALRVNEGAGPWRFIGVSGDARLELGSATARAQIRREQPPIAEIDRIHEVARARVLRAPLIIAVGVESGPERKTAEIDDLLSGAAAIQDMLVVANELGLTAVWHAGDACAAIEVKQLLDLPAGALLLGFIYVGHPTDSGARRPRLPSDDLISWLGTPTPSGAIHHAASL